MQAKIDKIYFPNEWVFLKFNQDPILCFDFLFAEYCTFTAPKTGFKTKPDEHNYYKRRK